MTSFPASRRLWHASRAHIDRPTIAGRTEGDNHANSGLGLFCATTAAEYITGFGATVHELTLAPDVRVMRLTIRELAKMGMDEQGNFRTRAQFDQLGRQWAKGYDLIELEESSGDVAQAIVLNDAAIVACKAMTAEEFLASLAPSRPSGPKP